jgi:DNA-binding CsgD family transcriptional regulator
MKRSVELFGRGAEQERLRALLDGARDRRSGSLVLVGEPGAGKSALIDDIRSAASEMTVLEARGVESEAELPFASLHQLLRPTFDLLERLPAPQASALRAAFGLGDGDPDLYRVPLAVLTLLAEAAEEKPLLCLIDDAHWMDRDSEQALTFAARRLQADGVAILFAARVGQFEAGSLPELRLEPLDGHAVEALLVERVGAPVAPEVASAIATATGGNALAVVELASLLTREHLQGREPLPRPLPMSAGVEGRFADQVRELVSATRLLLLVAAADDTGRPDVIAGAARQLDCDFDRLDDAERAGLIRIDAAEVRFRHPLIRSAVYGTATFTERAAVHRALADVLRQAGEIDRYAWHRAAATLEPDEAVATELEEAAQRARARNAFAAAAAAAERSADLSPSPAKKGRRLAEAASDAWLTGLLPQAERLLAAAEPLVDDPVLLANCHRLRGSIELAAGTTTTATAMLITGARRLAGVDPRRSLELLALAAEGASLTLDAEASRSIGQTASALEVSDEDEHDRFFIALLVGFTEHLAGDNRTGIAAIREALTIAEDEYDDVDLMLAAGRAGFYVGDDDAALRFHHRIVSRARSIGSVGCLAIAGTRLALAESLTGRWSEANATAEETVRLAEDTSQIELEAHGLMWLALIAAWQGEEERSKGHVDRARTLTAARPIRQIDDAGRWVTGATQLGAGRAPAALAQLAPIEHPVIAVLASLDRIEAALGASETDRANQWLGELESFAAASDASWARARVAHCHALMAEEPLEKESLFASALSDHAESGRPFERARTELAYGEFLRRNRRRVDAREHLRAALETFYALGARQWAERARAELRASGENARQPQLESTARLTAQEFRIAKFVSQGLSNREVASQMFLSPRTVDFHLRNIFTKLEVASRTELANLQLDTYAPAGQSATAR